MPASSNLDPLPGSARARSAGRPRRHEADELDRIILAKARNSFIRLGFGMTTIERVAADCGTTRRTVMHRFANRDELLLAVVKVTLKLDLAAVLAVESKVRPPIQRLRELCRRLLAYATDPLQYGLFRVLLGEIVRLPPLSRALMEHHDHLSSEIERMARNVEEIRDFRGQSAAAVANGVIGLMLANPINRAMMGDPRFQDATEIERYFEEMWGLLTG